MALVGSVPLSTTQQQTPGHCSFGPVSGSAPRDHEENDIMRISILGIAIVGLAVATLTHMDRAAAADLGVEVHGGTLGAGLGLGVGLSDRWNGRVGFNKYTFNENFTTSGGSDYSADLKLDSGYALADFHPFAGGFRITGGIMFNNNKVDGTATVHPGDEVGGQISPTGGKLSANVTFNDTAPYLGIGWGNIAHGWGPVSFSFDLGVMAQGKPKVDLRKESGLTGVSQQDIQREENDVQNKLDKFTLYPVASVGLLVRF